MKKEITQLLKISTEAERYLYSKIYGRLDNYLVNLVDIADFLHVERIDHIDLVNPYLFGRAAMETGDGDEETYENLKNFIQKDEILNNKYQNYQRKRCKKFCLEFQQKR